MAWVPLVWSCLLAPAIAVVPSVILPAPASPASLPGGVVAAQIPGASVGTVAATSANTNVQFLARLKGQPPVAPGQVGWSSSEAALMESSLSTVPNVATSPEAQAVSQQIPQASHTPLVWLANDWANSFGALMLAAVAGAVAGGLWWRPRTLALTNKNMATEMTATPKFAVAALASAAPAFSSIREASHQRPAVRDSLVTGASSDRYAPRRSPAVAMQSEKVDKIVDQMKELTLLEASELVTAIEDTFGVDASASAGAVMMAAPGAGGGGEEEAKAEQTEFDLVLKEVPKTAKIKVIKVIRALLDVGLKDAKDKADNPGALLEGKPKDIVEDAKKQLEEAGAVVELK